MLCTKVVQPVVQTAAVAKHVNVASLKDLSWSKANEILESRYGHMALSGLDSTSMMADSYLDYYLPQEEEEGQSDQDQSRCLHTLCTPYGYYLPLFSHVYGVLYIFFQLIWKHHMSFHTFMSVYQWMVHTVLHSAPCTVKVCLVPPVVHSAEVFLI